MGYLPRLFYDGVTLNTGAGGATAATDTISGQEYQRMKIIHGVDGTNDGDVAKTNPLPMRRIPIVDSGTAWSIPTPGAAVNSKVFKASAGLLREVTGINTKTTLQYIQVHNTTSTPSNGVTPVIVFPVEAGFGFSLDLGEDAQYFSTGITVTNSTTPATLTLGSADCIINGRYL